MPPLERRRSAQSLAPHNPLPADPHGQNLCEIFGRYPWAWIYADAPEPLDKPKWYTQRRYPLKNRILWRNWQDADQLIGVRPGKDIVYALIDIDINSAYHPNQDASAIAKIQAALETIGITRTILIRSSWSGGIHLYIPLEQAVKTFDLAVSLQNCLEAQGFRLKAGELEIFPNVKTYGTTQKIEYRAHRLPLQPESGSCLLDDEFNPGSSQLSDFLAQWDIAANGQNIATLQAALPIARQNRHKKVRKRFNKTQSWKTDLETILAEGWTGAGQTNQLLKEFGCYGVVFLELSGEDLINYIQQQAISSPGYKKWCRHQHEIEMRSRVWAASVEKYYWPLGSCSDIRQKAENDIVPFNKLRAQQAQASILAAVRQLEAVDQLPTSTTARAEAIRKAQAKAGKASSSMETLYQPENKKLWHPDYCGVQEEKSVIDVTVGASASETLQRESTEETLKPSCSKELRTKEGIMKCAYPRPDAFPSAKTKFYSEKGGTGGWQSFPQVKLPSTSQIPPISSPVPGIDAQQDEAIQGIQQQVRSLGWALETVTDFIASRFGGKRRWQLDYDELMLLLYYLRTAHQPTG